MGVTVHDVEDGLLSIRYQPASGATLEDQKMMRLVFYDLCEALRSVVKVHPTQRQFDKWGYRDWPAADSVAPGPVVPEAEKELRLRDRERFVDKLPSQCYDLPKPLDFVAGLKHYNTNPSKVGRNMPCLLYTSPSPRDRG